MTFERVRKQIESKPIKLKRYNKFNKPKDRKFGRSVYRCRKCGRTDGVIRSYGLMYCRQCFREEAAKLGFRKYM